MNSLFLFEPQKAHKKTKDISSSFVNFMCLLWFKKYCIASTFLLFCSLASAQSTLQKVETYLQGYHDSVPMPGFSVVIVKGDKVFLQKGYGVEQMGAKKSMTDQTVTGIGQLTMTMTATALLQLVEQGKVNLEDPVTKYLPWFKTANKPFSDQITLRMLLNHTAGIPAQFESLPSLNEATALEEFVRAMDGYYINKTPGLSYSFSREGYCVAGLVIQEVTGMSYAAYIEKNIFRPLGMDHTTTDPRQLKQLNALYGHEVGLTECLPAQASIFDAGYVPTGSEMRSTAKDIGHYLIALLNEGKYQGKQLLSPESVRQLFTPNISFSGIGTMLGGNGLDVESCLSWLKMNIDDRDLFIQTGNTGTMSSITGINFKNKTAATVLFNADSGRFDRYVYPSIENVGNNILHILADEPTTSFARPRFEDPFDEYYDIARSDWQKYVGTYVSIGDAHPVYKDYTIEVLVGDTDSLELKGYKEDLLKGHFKLQFSSKTRAVLRSIVHPREIQFKMNQNGAVTGVFIYGSEFKKQSRQKTNKPPFAVSNQQLQFTLPPDWKGEWSGDTYSAKFTQSENTQLSISSQTIASLSFEQLLAQRLNGQSILSKGVVKKETVRDGIWTEQSYCTSENGQTLQHLFVIYQDPLSQRQVQLLLTNPWGGFTNELQEMVRGFQRSVAF